MKAAIIVINRFAISFILSLGALFHKEQKWILSYSNEYGMNLWGWPCVLQYPEGILKDYTDDFKKFLEKKRQIYLQNDQDIIIACCITLTISTWADTGLWVTREYDFGAAQ